MRLLFSYILFAVAIKMIISVEPLFNLLFISIDNEVEKNHSLQRDSQKRCVSKQNKILNFKKCEELNIKQLWK